MRRERPANKSGTARGTLKFQLPPFFSVDPPKGELDPQEGIQFPKRGSRGNHQVGGRALYRTPAGKKLRTEYISARYAQLTWLFPLDPTLWELVPTWELGGDPAAPPGELDPLPAPQVGSSSPPGSHFGELDPTLGDPAKKRGGDLDPPKGELDPTKGELDPTKGDPAPLLAPRRAA